jgi:hypothetical protein
VGYPKEMRGYYFYNRKENKIVVAQSGVFLEREYLSRGGSGSIVSIEEVQEPLQDEPQGGNINAPKMVLNENQVEPIPQDVEEVQDIQEAQELDPQIIVDEVHEPESPIPRRSTRVSRQSKRYLRFHEILMVENEEPLTYKEAMDRPNSKE